ncbi:sulfate transporter CysZ [Vibrio gazogenes]|uniref:Sulfate transporter CysZ n=1 Tax=Vibrio gazogenes DSM 21264 = NBRC 103151 TaxID=1123492 RepID=A0A1M5DJA1_VIBGA|nr:sulfate transporter CysZ [Vibrio gazogenes]USP14597.1 sulfate transporter CysZ [Vibrio gazogenes]SHF67057.1 CysZ protein [Vibrio gazogenes DSM 21264] [Vibrio gazogenes DSM 21264 = NBRC 103151]
MTLKKRSGFGYFFFGMKLAVTPGIRRFVILPLLANVLLLGGALYYVFTQMGNWLDHLMSYVPDFLSWLNYIIWPLAVLSILFVTMYFFSAIANIIASPFNGLLAEKVEKLLDGHTINDEGLWSFFKDIPRIFAREWRKLRYTIPKMIGLFILLLIPGIGQTIGPLVWFIFTAWMLAIQYCDYPFDNHKVSFHTMRMQLKGKQGRAYGFGMLVTLFTTIPIINLIVMPAAVCGATAMWVNEFKAETLKSQN